MPARVSLPLKRLRPALALFLAATVLSGPAVAWQKGQVIEGRATAKDGDGIVIRGTEIRMQGVAAPEDNGYRVDAGGPEATRALSSLVDGEVVTCRLDGSRTRGRPVGICTLDGQDLGAVLIRNGYARDCPRYSGGRYRAAEMQARAGGADLSGIYELPGYC